MDSARVKARRDRTGSALVGAGLLLALVLGYLTAVDWKLGVALFLGLVCVVGFSRNATFAVCTFAAATYFEITVRYTGEQLSPIKLTGGALILVALATLLVRRRRPHADDAPAASWMRHPVVVGALAAFVLWSIASAAWAVDLTQVRALSERLVANALAFLAAGLLLVRVRQLAALGWTLLAAASLSTVVGMLIGADAFGRAVGTFGDPNEFAAALVPALALGAAAVQVARGPIARGAGLVLVGVCIYGVIASQSRGGLVAMLAVGAVALLTSRGRERVRLLGGAAVLVAATLVFLFLTPQGNVVAERLTSTDSSGRTDLWRVAAKQFADEPVHGVGLGNYPVVSKRYLTEDVRHTELFVANPRTTHNTTLELLAELGAVGALLYYGFLAGAVLVAMRGLRLARQLGDPAVIALGRGVLAAIIGSIATCVFLSGQYQELLWLLLAAGISYHAAVVRALAGQAAPAPVPALQLSGKRDPLSTPPFA